jgi:hypothetical protein
MAWAHLPHTLELVADEAFAEPEEASAELMSVEAPNIAPAH